MEFIFKSLMCFFGNNEHRCEFESQSGQGVKHYVIKFVSDLRQVGGFLRVLRFPHQ
jgi:hypothetical protein